MSGLDIDIRSDIYSLGVMLYELLTGTTPFTKEVVSKFGYDELRRLIREEAPQRASARVSTLKAEQVSTLASNQRSSIPQLSRQLRGELDWVIAKALDKDRTRRYQSAIEFASDISRFLEGDPVVAHPPSLAYRIGKLARRHRSAAITASVIFLSLIVSTLVSIRYAFKAGAAEQRAQEQRDAADRQRIIAVSKEREAETQRSEADSQRRVAQREQSLALDNLYVSDMRLSAVDLQNLNIPRLRTTLDRYAMKNSDQDRRGWEWYYLLSKSSQDTRSFPHYVRAEPGLALSPDGSMVACTTDGGPSVWDTESGKLLKHLSKGRTIKYGADWSPDGRFLAWGSAADENWVLIWDKQSDEISVLEGYDASVNDVQWNRDGTRIASTSADGSCRIWNPSSGQCVGMIRPETGSPNNVDWHPKANRIALSAIRGISVWEVDSESLVQVTNEIQECTSVKFTKDGQHLLVGDSRGRCYLLSSEDLRIVKEWNAHYGSCNAIACFQSEKFATCGADSLVRVWKLPECKEVRTLYGHRASVIDIDWNANGSQLVSQSQDSQVKLWDLAAASEADIVDASPVIAEFHQRGPEGPKLADRRLSSVDGTMRLTFDGCAGLISGLGQVGEVSFDTGIATLSDRPRSAFDILFLPLPVDPAAIIELAGSELDGEEVKLPTASDYGELMHIDSGYIKGTKFFWSADRKTAVTATHKGNRGQGELVIWDALDVKKLAVHQINSAWPFCTWDNAGTRFALAGIGEAVQIYDRNSGELTRRMLHARDCTAVDWEPTGSRIVSGDEAGMLKCWDAASGSQLWEFRASPSAITEIAWSPTEDRIAVSGASSRVRIIDANKGNELIALEAEDSFAGVVWSANGRELFGLTQNSQVYRWDASPGYQRVESAQYDFESAVAKLSNLRLGDYLDLSKQEQLSLVNHILSMNPDNIRALWYRAEYYQRIPENEQAAKDYGKIIDSMGRNQIFWNNYGYTLYELNRLEEAKAAFEKVIDLGPRWPGGWDGYISSLARLNRPTEAIEQALLDLKEQSSGSWAWAESYCAMYALYSGDLDTYRRICNELLSSTEEKEAKRRAVETAVLSTESSVDFDEVVQTAEDLHRIEPDNKEFQFYLGAAHYRAGNADRALAHLGQAFAPEATTPGPASNLLFQAMCHHAKRDRESAEQLLTRALEEVKHELGEPQNFKQQMTLELLREEAGQTILN